MPWREPGLCSRGLEPDSNPNSTTFSLGDCRHVTSFSRASVSSQMEMGLIDRTRSSYPGQGVQLLSGVWGSSEEGGREAGGRSTCGSICLSWGVRELG